MRRLVLVGAASALLVGAAVGDAKIAWRKTVRLDRGDRITIVLPSNPSTGYSWRVARKPNARVLRLVRTRFTPPDEKPPVVGAPGTFEAEFEAVGAGRTTARLDYVGPGRDRPVGERFTLTAIVR